MRNGTDKNPRIPAIACAAVVIAVLLFVLLGVFFPLLGEVRHEPPAAAVILLYGAVIAAVIIGVFAALRQRLRELGSGEEDDAKKY